MAKNKEQKQEIIKNLEEKIKSSKSIALAGFNALGVKDNEELRKQLSEVGGEYYVAKKTLLNIALKNQGVKDFDPSILEGKVATIFSYEDEVSGAKVIDNFRKNKEKAEKIYFQAGFLGDKLLNQEEIEHLAKIPAKQELLANLVGSLNAPISAFVNTLSANLREFVQVLKAIEEKK